MEKHFIFFIVILLINSNSIRAQNNGIFENKNSVQVEFGGHGLFYSFNYERIFINTNKFKSAGQFGISYYPPKSGIRDIWMPIGINEIFSFNNHHIETGLGFVIIREAIGKPDYSRSDWFWSGLMSGRVGYRYQKPKGHLILRVAFTPFLELSSLSGVRYINGPQAEFIPFGGLSIGYSF